MAYLQVWTCVEGAIDDDRNFADNTEGAAEYADWLATLEQEAKRDGFSVEVYEIYHGHDETDEDCECVQYLTDHHPAYVFGPDSE